MTAGFRVRERVRRTVFFAVLARLVDLRRRTFILVVERPVRIEDLVLRAAAGRALRAVDLAPRTFDRARRTFDLPVIRTVERVRRILDMAARNFERLRRILGLAARARVFERVLRSLDLAPRRTDVARRALDLRDFDLLTPLLIPRRRAASRVLLARAMAANLAAVGDCERYALTLIARFRERIWRAFGMARDADTARLRGILEV